MLVPGCFPQDKGSALPGPSSSRWTVLRVPFPPKSSLCTLSALPLVRNPHPTLPDHPARQPPFTVPCDLDTSVITSLCFLSIRWASVMDSWVDLPCLGPGRQLNYGRVGEISVDFSPRSSIVEIIIFNNPVCVARQEWPNSVTALRFTCCRCHSGGHVVAPDQS